MLYNTEDDETFSIEAVFVWVEESIA
jgi:hypothetical protein